MGRITLYSSSQTPVRKVIDSINWVKQILDAKKLAYMEIDLSMMVEQKPVMKRLAEKNKLDLPRRTDIPQLYFNEKIIIHGPGAIDRMDQLINSKELDKLLKELQQDQTEPEIPKIGIWHPGNGKKPRITWGDFTGEGEEEEDWEDGDWEYDDDDDEDEYDYEYEYEDEAPPKKKEKPPKPPREITEDEREETRLLVKYINKVLGEDQYLIALNKMPLNGDDESLFDKTRDGVIYCKLINRAVPDTVDERVITIKKKLSKEEKHDNITLVLQSAKSIGCIVSGISPPSLLEGKVSTVLMLLWQIIRIGLLERVSIKYHPELVRLVNKNEQVHNFMNLAPDLRLLRWFNTLLAAAGLYKTYIHIHT